MFQSTHSLRSATYSDRVVTPKAWVSIHALLAECDDIFDGVKPEAKVSIHALLAECDSSVVSLGGTVTRFQSTHSLRSATPCFCCTGIDDEVSIHALLAECDICERVRFVNGPSFNPRTPCGVRRYSNSRVAYLRKFQSTHSLRSATAPDHIHCYSTAQTILCANLPKKAIIT